MKRIFLLIIAALMVFTFSVSAAEQPETGPAETPAAEEVPAETEAPEEEVPPQETEDIPGEETPGSAVPPEEPETTPGEESLPGEEEPAAEAVCTHEHTETVYYFDTPEYRPLNDESHLVAGQAVAEVTCLDCGALLSQDWVDDAEEIRPHVFRNGLCVLCGREAAADEAAPEQTESVIHLTAGEEPEQYSCTLTGDDLADAGDTLVLRAEGREAAIAVQTQRLREEIDRAGGKFTARMWKPGERDVSTVLCLYDAYGEEVVPVAQGFTLRIYTENRGEPLTVSYTNLSGATSSEEARWVNNSGDEGYWSVTWLGDGVYEYR